MKLNYNLITRTLHSVGIRDDGVKAMIEDFAFDEENEDEIAAHGLSPEQLLQVLDGPYRLTKNRRQRRATHLIIGRDRQSQCIAIPVEPTPLRTIWRPVTAWYCKAHEWGWLPPES